MNDFNKIYQKKRAIINQKLEEIEIPPGLSKFKESLIYPLESKGKRFRPILLLAVGEALGKNQKDLLPAALAIEILHTFTLVHDDIMDGDDMRRGLPTVHNKWDMATAILAGDGLFALAYKELMKLEVSEINVITSRISDALLKICEGQIRDLNFEDRSDVTPQEYLDMVELKTGELLGLACSIGAIVGETSSEIVAKMDIFGKILGQAFQIQDDILEIESDEEQMGKSLGSDFAAGKKTYPLTIIMSQLKGSERENIISFLKNNSYNRQEVLDKFEQYNAIKKSKALVAELIDQALQELDGCPEKIQNTLKYFVKLISNREY